MKGKHTGLTNSEFAKELVRIGVLEEKLYLWWKLQFAAQDAKIKGSVFSVFFLLFFDFWHKTQTYWSNQF